MEQAKAIKDAKVIEVVQVVYLAGKENSSTNPLRLITEYRSKDGAFHKQCRFQLSQQQHR